MKQGSNPKQKRKQAEDTIIKNMRIIQSRLEKDTIAVETVEKERVMTVLTRFLHLKKSTKMH